MFWTDLKHGYIDVKGYIEVEKQTILRARTASCTGLFCCCIY